MAEDTNQTILDLVQARFPTQVKEHDTPYGFLSLVIDHDSIIEIILSA